MNEAQQQLATLLAQGATSVPRFAPNSRYYTTATVDPGDAGWHG